MTKSLNSETILALRPVKTCGILASIAGGHRDLTSSQVTLGVDPKNLFVISSCLTYLKMAPTPKYSSYDLEIQLCCEKLRSGGNFLSVFTQKTEEPSEGHADLKFGYQ